ncbi:hypothetical protein CDAR_553891 [Caerostris darwini]|uniref:Uncharacterized protein n=1 Tax=Caerostris darwini TaxID=1538125 RepID=A0AAV4WN86_9ARAC|nr:hypothetical protein CDAR_553891 [Caerostris darwini]
MVGGEEDIAWGDGAFRIEETSESVPLGASFSGGLGAFLVDSLFNIQRSVKKFYFKAQRKALEFFGGNKFTRQLLFLYIVVAAGSL